MRSTGRQPALLTARRIVSIAVHPAEKGGSHELFFMCENVETFVTGMAEKGIVCGEVGDLSWGRLARMRLPGGGDVGVYEPKHERPPSGG